MKDDLQTMNWKTPKTPIRKMKKTPTSSLDIKTLTTEVTEVVHSHEYCPHPVAALFPPMSAREYQELRDSIHDYGQIEPVVVDGDILLDGRHRLRACRELGIEPWIVQWSALRPVPDTDQAGWIKARNLERRNLTDDQRLAIAAKYQAWRIQGAQSGTAAAEGTASGSAQKTDTQPSQPAGNSATSEYPQEPAEKADKPKRGRKPGARSAAEATAKETGQSRYRAEAMLKLRALSQKLAVAVEEGHVSLKEAIRQLKAAQPHTKKLHPRQPACKETIEKVAASAIERLRKKAERFELADRPALWGRVAELARAEITPSGPESNTRTQTQTASVGTAAAVAQVRFDDDLVPLRTLSELAGKTYKIAADSTRKQEVLNTIGKIKRELEYWADWQEAQLSAHPISSPHGATTTAAAGNDQPQLKP